MPDDKFDLIVLNGVIEHMYDSNLKTLFSDIKEKLLSGGAIFIVVANIFAPQIIFQKLKKTSRPDLEVGHVNLKTKREWKKFVGGFDFTNFRFSYFPTLKKHHQMVCFRNKFINNVLKPSINLFLLPFFYHLRNSYYITVKR
ncbi:hypothetical protein UZ36_00075 [Candidatus Nitromaritima sp. SCGC AAA799-C22]|nr:hypothetical protein UZ36_00075 [Candidatus Nitromaritima sp. SCGC AAA799-C22]